MWIRRSAYNNWNGRIGRLYFSYDIRNDRAWRKRRWHFRWSKVPKGIDPAERFLHELRAALAKCKEDIHENPNS